MSNGGFELVLLCGDFLEDFVVFAVVGSVGIS
jgi:hypothetical protein